MEIAIIGVGVVGNALKTYFTSRGLRVATYDKFKEEGSLVSCLSANILFLCLPTYFGVDEYDKKDIYITCESLVNYDYKGLIVLKSTVEPCTTKEIEQRFPSLKIVHNPEFLSADTAFKDFTEQKHIVIGGAPSLTKILAEFYRLYFPTAEISECSSVESESMKIFINNFYAVKIQFFNELYLACKDNGANFETVRDMMLKNGWINPQHTRVPGKDGQLSYDGMCFPKDTCALLQYMLRREVPCAVIEATVRERSLFRSRSRSL
jgi:nucleotide sugar dehydrogenase